MRIIIVIFVFFLMSGCSSITKEPRWNNAGSPSSTLLVYRDAGGHNKAMPANFGSSKNYIVGLKDKEYIKLSIPSGEETLKVAGAGSTSETIRVNLDPNESKCIKIEPNAAQLSAAVVAIPVLLAAIPTYHLIDVECPTEDYLSSLSQLGLE